MRTIFVGCKCELMNILSKFVFYLQALATISLSIDHIHDVVPHRFCLTKTCRNIKNQLYLKIPYKGQTQITASPVVSRSTTLGVNVDIFGIKEIGIGRLLDPVNHLV